LFDPKKTSLWQISTQLPQHLHTSLFNTGGIIPS
jgi:hypothetical protein